jgi:hypothetical protein
MQTFEDYCNMVSDQILDNESEFLQIFDDIADGQRDSYLDSLNPSLEGPK